ncbi:MAG: ABC transporter ATP-binding protein [Planctomycetota bacterium]
MTDRLLEARQLTIGHARPGRAPIVVGRDISVTLASGELVCLLGPNGVGKSTLLRTLSGLQPSLQGDVMLLGERLSSLEPEQLAKRLAVVLTERLGIGAMSVEELVRLGRHPHTGWSGRLKSEDLDYVAWAIEAAGIEPLRHRLVTELSDGERQKAMIARALAQGTDVLILDEPTAFLDLPRRVEILRLLRNLSRSSQRAMLLSTHDLDLALRGADRLWLMSSGGTLHAGAPEDLVLSGAFQQLFHAEGIDFNPRTGNFQIHDPPCAFVRLKPSGQEIVDFWTVHALERAGYGIASNDQTSVATLEITTTGPTPRWRLDLNGTVNETVSLEEMLQGLVPSKQTANAREAIPGD